MGKNNEELSFEKIFKKYSGKIAIETVNKKISYNNLEKKVFSLIEYFKSKV